MTGAGRDDAAPGRRTAGPARGVRRRATGADVAAAAGVSTSVVSLVLNGKDAGRVQPETRARVLAAAGDLGYRIDGRGRSLATGRTGIVGFVAPDSTTPYFASVQRGLLRGLNPDFQLMTVVTDLGREVSERSLHRLLATGPDALIVVGLAGERVAALQPGCPVLVLDSPGRDPAPDDSTGAEATGADATVSPARSGRFPRINLDVVSSAAALGAHLAELGHRSVVYLDADTRAASMELRRRALLGALRRGRPGGHTVVARCAIDVAAARELVLARWERWARAGVTAICCGSDLQAFGALAALRELGRQVPGEVSVTGADDQPMSTVVQPALTTVRLPSAQLGELAARRARALISGGTGVPELQVLDTELVLRESTGPV